MIHTEPTRCLSDRIVTEGSEANVLSNRWKTRDAVGWAELKAQKDERRERKQVKQVVQYGEGIERHSKRKYKWKAIYESISLSRKTNQHTNKNGWIERERVRQKYRPREEKLGRLNSIRGSACFKSQVVQVVPANTASGINSKQTRTHMPGRKSKSV